MQSTAAATLPRIEGQRGGWDSVVTDGSFMSFGLAFAIVSWDSDRSPFLGVSAPMGSKGLFQIPDSKFRICKAHAMGDPKSLRDHG
jgi:hypothetical protein